MTAFFNTLSNLHTRLATGISDTDLIDKYVEAMQNFSYTVDCVKDGIDLLNHKKRYSDDNTTIGQKILSGDMISDEKIVEEAKDSGLRLELAYNRLDYNHHRTKDVIKTAKALLSAPENAISLIIKPFQSENAKEICNNYKEDLLKPRCQYIFERAKDAFTKGMSDLCLLYNHKYEKCLPKEFSTDLARFIATDQNFRTFFEANINRTTARSIYPLIEWAHVDEKPKIINIIAGDPLLKSTLIGSFSDPGELIITLSRGLTPIEFDRMLNKTGFLSSFESLNNPSYNADSKNWIAVEALKHFEPEYLKKEGYKALSSISIQIPPIEKLCTNMSVARHYKEHAEEIMAIAHGHCKPSPNSGDANNLKYG